MLSVITVGCGDEHLGAVSTGRYVMPEDLVRLGYGIKIAIDACRQKWVNLGKDIIGATNAEKDMQKAKFAREHSNWPNEKKRKYNEKWAQRDSFPPHVPGSPKVFPGV